MAEREVCESRCMSAQWKPGCRAAGLPDPGGGPAHLCTPGPTSLRGAAEHQVLEASGRPWVARGLRPLGPLHRAHRYLGTVHR